MASTIISGEVSSWSLYISVVEILDFFLLSLNKWPEFAGESSMSPRHLLQEAFINVLFLER